MSCQEGSGKQSPGGRRAEAGGQVLRGGHMCKEPTVNTGTGSWRIQNFPKLTRKDCKSRVDKTVLTESAGQEPAAHSRTSRAAESPLAD